MDQLPSLSHEGGSRRETWIEGADDRTRAVSPLLSLSSSSPSHTLPDSAHFYRPKDRRAYAHLLISETLGPVLSPSSSCVCRRREPEDPFRRRRQTLADEWKRIQSALFLTRILVLPIESERPDELSCHACLMQASFFFRGTRRVPTCDRTQRLLFVLLLSLLATAASFHCVCCLFWIRETRQQRKRRKDRPSLSHV